MQTSGAPRREIAEPYLESAVIARSACDEAILVSFPRKDGLLRWSLSSGAHSRDPLARNDVEEAYALSTVIARHRVRPSGGVRADLLAHNYASIRGEDF